VREVTHGAPAKIFKLDCAPCEQVLHDDPLWSSTISEIPESHDERLTREDWEKRGEHDLRYVEAIAAARNAKLQIPETLTRALELSTGVRFSAVAGQIECEAGHPNEPGTNYCAECGLPLHAPTYTCPDGHEVAAKAKFCAECGQPVTAVPALEAAPAPARPSLRRLRDMRAADLAALAREKGLDDSGSRADLIGRLRAAA
jgi:hypothetical protein